MTSVAAPPYTNTQSTTTIDVKVTNHLDTLSAGEKKEISIGILSDPSNRDLVRQDIDKLCANTQATRAAFEKISILLGKFDEKAFKNKQNEAIKPLRPNWDELRKEYNQLLSDSKDDAGDIKAMCDFYQVNVASVLLEKNAKMRLSDVRDQLASFTKRIAKLSGNAKLKSTSFDDLRYKVEQAKSDINQAFADASADPTGRAPGLREEIKTLKTQISEAQTYIDNCMTAMKVAGVIGGVGAILSTFCPAFGFLTVAAAIAGAGSAALASKKKAELEGYQKSLKTKETELADIEEREKVLADLRKELSEDQTSFATIIHQLTALSTFWQAVSKEIDGTITQIDGLDEDDTLFTHRNTLGPELVGTIYENLGAVLGKYISQMGILEKGE